MSGNQIKTISEIILHKDEPLARHLIEAIVGDELQGITLNKAIKVILEARKSLENFDIQADESIEEALLNVDKIAIDLSPYDKSLLHDIQKGTLGYL